MKMIITIDIDKDWIRREADSYKGFFTGYINQISGLKVSEIVIEDDSEESWYEDDTK